MRSQRERKTKIKKNKTGRDEKILSRVTRGEQTLMAECHLINRLNRITWLCFFFFFIYIFPSFKVWGSFALGDEVCRSSIAQWVGCSLWLRV